MRLVLATVFLSVLERGRCFCFKFEVFSWEKNMIYNELFEPRAIFLNIANHKMHKICLKCWIYGSNIGLKKWLNILYIFSWNKMELYSRGRIRYSQSLPYLLLFKPLPRAQNLIILSSTRSATAIFTKFEKKICLFWPFYEVDGFMKSFYPTKARSLSCRLLSNVQSLTQWLTRVIETWLVVHCTGKWGWLLVTQCFLFIMFRATLVTSNEVWSCSTIWSWNLVKSLKMEIDQDFED